MSSAALSYRGPAKLTLTYGATPGLSRISERPSIEVVVSRPAQDAPISVLLDRHMGVAMLLAPGVTHVSLALPNGSVLAGAVQEISESGDYFEICAVSHATQGSHDD